MDNTEKFKFLRNIHIFHSLSDQELAKIAKQFTLKEYSEGKKIFEENNPSDYFYVIVSGTIELSRQEDSIGTLGRNATFGEEELIENENRQATATSLEDSALLRLEKKAFDDMLEKYARVKDVMERLLESYEIARRKNFSWLREGELVRFIDQRHFAVFIRRALLPILLFIVSGLVAFFGVFQTFPTLFAYLASIPMIIAVLWGFWLFVDWGNDYYIVTNNRIILLEKVVWVYDQRIEAPHQTILSINTTSNQIQRIFGYADVIVRTHTGKIIMDNAANPEHLAGISSMYWHRAEEHLKEERIANITKTIRQKLGFEEKTAGEEIKAENGSESGPEEETPSKEITFTLPQWVRNMLPKARSEVDGVITYRKHIFILLKRIWLYLLIFVVLTALLISISNLSSFFAGRVLLFLIGAGILFTAFYLWYHYTDWKNDLFQITSNEIVDMDRKPLGQVTRKSASLENILSLEFRRENIIQRLLNFGTVYVNVGEIQLDFENVSRPDMVQAEIFEYYYAALRREEENEAKRHRDDVVEFLAIYHEENKRHESTITDEENTKT